MPITLLLADRLVMVREAMRALLEASGSITVVGEAGDGRETVRLVKQLRPAVAVLSSTLPELNGFDAANILQELVPSTALILLEALPTVERTYRALHGGVAGFVFMDSGSASLLEAIRTVVAGRRYFDARIPEQQIDELLSRGPSTSPLESLSERERQILQMVVEGKTSAQIAAMVHLSRKTVETYRSRTMEKLGIHNMPLLVKFAIRHGLTTLE